LKAKQAIYTQI